MDEEPELRELKLRSALLALLLITGCFTPVVEVHPHPVHKDAGHSDGGVKDGGATDAGHRDGGCATFADCAFDGGVLCEFQSASPGASCINGGCINECPGNRTCVADDPTVPNDAGHCLQCVGRVRDCALGGCLAGPHCQFKISVSNCPSLPVGTTFSVATRTDCQQIVPGLGSWVGFTAGAAIANFPSLGGTCTGLDLFTGVPRMEFTCPGCQFVEEGCE